MGTKQMTGILRDWSWLEGGPGEGYEEGIGQEHSVHQTRPVYSLYLDT
jgi:hypothetical protein